MIRQRFPIMLGIALACAAAHAEETAPTATPYRPTISNPAELSTPGWLEIEAGLQRNRDGGVQRSSVPYVAKVAFDENWGVLLGGEARVVETTPEARLSGWGDTILALKHRLPTVSEELNFGVEVGVKMPTARTGLGSGKADWAVNGIASLDLAESWRLDANLGATRLGVQTEGEGRTWTLWAAALSHAIGAWTIAAELAGTRQSGVPSSRQWMAAASYNVVPRLVLDFGTALNHQGEERQRSYFVGLTWLAAKLF